MVKRLKTGEGFEGDEVREDFERSWGVEES